MIYSLKPPRNSQLVSSVTVLAITSACVKWDASWGGKGGTMLACSTLGGKNEACKDNKVKIIAAATKPMVP